MMTKRYGRGLLPASLGLLLNCLLGCGADVEPGGVSRVNDRGSANSPDGGDGGERERIDGPAAFEPEPRFELDFFAGDGGNVEQAPIIYAQVGQRRVRGIWDHNYTIYFDNDPAKGVFAEGIDKIDEQEGRAEIAKRIAWLKANKFNAVFLWVVSSYLDAVKTGRIHQGMGHTVWDPLLVYRQEAQKAGIEVHFWYAPNNYKYTYLGWGQELIDNPDWHVIGDDGVTMLPGVDLANADARDYQIELIEFLDSHYRPDGIQIEEPYYQYVEVPQTDAFLGLYKSEMGTDAPSTRDATVIAVMEDVHREFFDAARSVVTSGAVFQANGPAGIAPTLGTDFVDLAERGVIDVYVPQIYTTTLGNYQNLAKSMHSAIFPNAGMFIGTSIKSSSTPDGNPDLHQQLLWAEAGDGAPETAGTIAFAHHSADAESEGFSSRAENRVVAVLGREFAEDDSDPTWTNDGLRFDGVDDMVAVDAGQALDVYGHVFLEFTLKVDALDASWSTILQRGDQGASRGFLWVFVDEDARVNFQIATGNEYTNFVSNRTDLLDGKFHTIRIRQNRAGNRTVAFEMDGEPIGEFELGSKRSLPVTGGTVWIGTYGGRVDPQYMFKGVIRDIKVARHFSR